MKKITVIGKLLCVFKPKKTNPDILSEAEDIINQYICEGNEFEYLGQKEKVNKLNVALNITIIISTLFLAYLVFRAFG